MYSYDAEKGTVCLTRGDSLHLPVVVTDTNTGEAVDPSSVEKITLTVRDGKEDGAKILLQSQADGGVLHILPKDTAGLGFGTFFYDVEAVFATGDVYTYGVYRFKILKEATY